MVTTGRTVPRFVETEDIAESPITPIGYLLRIDTL